MNVIRTAFLPQIKNLNKVLSASRFTSTGVDKGLVFRFFDNKLVFTSTDGTFDLERQVVVVSDLAKHQQFSQDLDKYGLKSGDPLSALLYKMPLSKLIAVIRESHAIY